MQNKPVERREKGLSVWMADLLCVVAAAIWGAGFIASQMAIEARMSAALIMALRFALAALVTLAACAPRLKNLRTRDIKMGGLAGLFLFGGFYMQIVGQQHTTVARCAFLSATYVVIVPFLVWIVSRRRPPVRTFVLTGATLAGIGVLCAAPGGLTGGFSFGDAMTLVCALLFAMHITSLSRACQGADALLINLVQLATAAIVAVAVFLLTDLDAVACVDWHKGLPAVAYLGLLGTCLCYFLQALAQKHTSPAHAGVLLSTEGLFGSLFSVLLGFEALTGNLVVGGLMILASIILMEALPEKTKER